MIPIRGGATLGAGPSGPDDAGPAIGVVPGLGGLTEGGRRRHAERFAEAGDVPITRDHCNAGLSGGWLRHDIDPRRHILDWRRVITYSQDLPGVDCTRRSFQVAAHFKQGARGSCR